MKYSLLALLGLNCLSCGFKGKNNKKDEIMTNCYAWSPAASAPKLFTVESRYVIFYVGEEHAHYPVIYSELGRGVGKATSDCGITDVTGQMDMPYGFKAIWLSYAERKVYGGEFLFNEEQRERYKKLFLQGYTVTRKFKGKVIIKHYTYNTFCVTFLPGGKALLHITGAGRRVYVDCFQCEELKDITLEELNFPYQTDCKTVQELFESDLKYEQYKPMLDYIKEHGIPYTLWDKYLERFNYKIKIEFENEQTFLDPDYGYGFTNGEMFFNNDEVEVDSMARIQGIAFTWTVADTLYKGHFYFTEKDVLEVFDKAYGTNRTQPGELVIRVGKYNNLFEIYLRVGDKKYQLNDELFNDKDPRTTMIHVFKKDLNKPEEESIVYYNNHRHIHSDDIKFVGE